MIGIINGIVTQRAFAHNGGYGAQMDAIKEYGLFDGYSEKFTTGTTGLILHGFWGKVILILAGIQLMLIVYKKQCKRIHTIIGSQWASSCFSNIYDRLSVCK